MKTRHTLTARPESPRQRRKSARQARRHTATMPRKASHILAPEICVLHVQGVGYLQGVNIEARAPEFTRDPEGAMLFAAEGVTRQVDALRQQFGLVATVRPYRPQGCASVVACHAPDTDTH